MDQGFRDMMPLAKSFALLGVDEVLGFSVWVWGLGSARLGRILGRAQGQFKPQTLDRWVEGFSFGVWG